MARYERLDYGLCQRMCDLSTKQDKHSPTSHSPLPHHCPRGCTSLPTNSNGPYHRTPAKQWERCDSHHCGPWMLTCSSLSAVQHHYHGPRHRAALPPTHLQMVWTATKNHQRPRPTDHVPLWESSGTEARHQPKPIHNGTPPNRRPIRAKESMGGTIPTPRNLPRARDLG
jgi:hypothetical protein